MAGIEPQDLECLTPADGYWDAPIPEPRDFEIVSLLRRAQEGDQLGRVIEAARPDQESAVLRCFAERMASLVVRRQQPDLLRTGLVAIGIANTRTGDPRDEIGVLAPLWHGARRLGLDAAAEFAAAATAVPSAAPFFSEWVARPPRLQTLSSMGYVESSDAGGFRYVRDTRPPVFGRGGMRSGLLGIFLIFFERVRRPVPPNPRLDPFRDRVARVHTAGEPGGELAGYLLVTALDCWKAEGTWRRPRLVDGRELLEWTFVELAGTEGSRESYGLEDAVDDMVDELTAGQVRLEGRDYTLEWLAGPAAARVRKQYFRRRASPFA